MEKTSEEKEDEGSIGLSHIQAANLNLCGENLRWQKLNLRWQKRTHCLCVFGCVCTRAHVYMGGFAL